MITESDLELALKESWCKETSYEPHDWSSANPAFGQCAVTALVVNDYLGGEIVFADAILPDETKVPHYFNRVDGEEKDFTRTQFPKGTIIPNGVLKTKGQLSAREYILSYRTTFLRYELLKHRVQQVLE